MWNVFVLLPLSLSLSCTQSSSGESTLVPATKETNCLPASAKTPTGEALLSRVKLGLLARRNFILASIDMYLEHRAASGLLKVPILF